MEFKIKTPSEDEAKSFLQTTEKAFGYAATDEDIARFTKVLEMERSLSVVDGDRMVATAGAFRFSLTVPGNVLPAAGVTVIGVLPSHRRRGILNALMRRQFEDIHSWGEPLAVLWASEGNIYDRYGYGLATRQMSIDIERDRALFRTPVISKGKVRLLEMDEAVKRFPDVYDRVCASTPGMYERWQAWWEAHVLADPENDRDGGGPKFYALLEIEDQAEAYAIYRVHGDWGEDGVPKGHVAVHEEVATSPVATQEIWRFIFGIDLVARFKSYFLPIDHPLQHLLSEPRRLRMNVKDAVWLRVVDVKRALEERRYADEGRLVFELADELCPWNAGRWRLDARRDGGSLSPTNDEPDVVLTATELGAVYLGGVSFSELERADRIRGGRPGAAFDADRLFRTERAPWCPEIF